DVTLFGDLDVTSDDRGSTIDRGTVEVNAWTGRILMSGSAPTSTAGGNIRYSAASDIVLGSVSTATNASQSAWGDVAIASRQGGIGSALVTGSPAVNIQANHARMTAALGIGAADRSLRTELATVAASTAAPGIWLLDLTDLSIGFVGSVSTSQVLADGTVEPTTDLSAIDGITTSQPSVILVQVASGNLLIDSPVTTAGSSSVTLGAFGGSVFISAPVTGGLNDGVNVAASENILFFAPGGQIAVPGTVNLLAAGSIANRTSVAMPTVAAGDLIISTGSRTIASIANLTLQSTRDLTISGAGLSLQNADLDVQSVRSLVIAGPLTAAGSGSIKLQVSDGELLVQHAVQATGTGSIRLTATTASPVTLPTDRRGNIIVAGPVATTTGSISISADQNLTQRVAGDLTTVAGTVTFTAMSGDLLMESALNDDAVTTSNGGAIRYSAGRNILVSALLANTGDVILQAGGFIQDANGSLLNVLASQLSATALLGVELDTRVVSAVVENSGVGAIVVRDFDAIAITRASTANGPITITAGGFLEAVDVTSLAVDNGLNTIALTSLLGGIKVYRISAGISNDVVLQSLGGSITQDNDAEADVIADVLTVTAAGGVNLDTDISRVDLITTNPGNVILNELNDITLTSVATANGSVLVLA
ncbi:MAG: beta strand repeat-containing protein, partial [Planctomycetota bacterium]